MVNLGGRPRKYDLDKEADDLMEWANNPKSLVMKSFAVPKEYTYENMLDWVRNEANIKFSECYAKAKGIVTARREEMVLGGQLNQKYFDRFLPLYDSEVRRVEREIAKEKVQDEIEIKKAEMQTVTQDAINLNSAIVDGIKELQRLARLKKPEQNVIDAD